MSAISVFRVKFNVEFLRQNLQRKESKSKNIIANNSGRTRRLRHGVKHEDAHSTDDICTCLSDCESGTTVIYASLPLPDCAWSSEQLNGSIKYVLEISATKSDPGGTGQLRAYDHLYYVSCVYDNQNRTWASFEPSHEIHRNNASNTGYFTFMLQAFPFSNYTGAVTNPVALNKILYFKAMVLTKSSASNLDLFPVHCWSSKSKDPALDGGKFTLIKDGCGNSTVSEDRDDTLSYNCTSDSVEETFSIRSFRYFGAAGRRKRRAIVDESNLHHVKAGPFIFKDDEEEEKDEEAGEPQSLPTNLAVTVAVSGVAALAIICATAYLVVRSCNKRKQRGDLNVAT
ncbi:hypothetical protein ACROYT_G039729 [Oculina patagonica]